jgi:hypothetical protein
MGDSQRPALLFLIIVKELKEVNFILLLLLDPILLLALSSSSINRGRARKIIPFDTRSFKGVIL